MKRLIVLLVLFGFPAWTHDRTIRLGIHDNPPSTLIQNGIAKGFVVDIIGDFAARYDYHVDHVIAPFPELMEMIQTGKIDLLAPIAFSVERSRLIFFNQEPLMFSWATIVIHKQSSFTVLADLAEKTMGVVKDDRGYQALKEEMTAQKIPIQYREYGNFREMVIDVDEGRIDAALLYRSSLDHMLHSDKRAWNLKVMPGSILYESLFFGVNHNRSELVPQLDDFLSKLKKSPGNPFQQIYDRWYAEPYSRFSRFLFQNSPWLIALGLTLVIGIVTFNLALRRRVVKATREISRQKSFFQNLFHNNPAGIVILNESGRIIDQNLEFLKLFGFTAKEIKGKHLDELIDDETTLTETLLYNQQIIQGMRIDKEVMRFNREKQSLQLHMIGSPIFFENQLLGSLFIFIDISTSKKMEEEVLKARNIESIGVLAGGIAHDFNNMLTGILGNISLAKILAKNGRTMEILEKAEKAALKTRGLTRQLLTFTKGGIPQKKVSSIREIVQDSVDLMLEGSEITTLIEMEDPIGNVNVDITQISQVMNNILLNAKEAMPGGGQIKISIFNHIADGDGGPDRGSYVAVAVHDDGPGIDPEIQKNLFVPFHTSKEGGTGLGLAISYSILKKHRGTITVESAPETGTTFTIYLPATHLLVEREIKPDSRIRRRARILLMDDEPMVREVFQDMMTTLNFEIFTTVNSSEAISLFSQQRNIGQPFDLVFLDLTVPGDIGGIETLEKIREIDAAVKAIVTTGYVRHDVFDSPDQFHFIDILHKPFQLEELLAVIDRGLKKG